MSVYSVRPPVCDLVFQLYGRPLHPELFDILAVRTDPARRLQAHSPRHAHRPRHHLGKRRRLSDRSGRRSRSGIAPTPPFTQLPSARRIRRPTGVPHGIYYQVCFQVEVLPPEIFLHVQDELRADGEKAACCTTSRPNTASTRRRSASSTPTAGRGASVCPRSIHFRSNTPSLRRNR